mmetsp:Transcript_725/g.1932  ORF Transcript_725/g.1932 Transcript_725/m.1932 type:complete len:177 (-) Transcript_725:792-1322(-)
MKRRPVLLVGVSKRRLTNVNPSVAAPSLQQANLDRHVRDGATECQINQERAEDLLNVQGPLLVRVHGTTEHRSAFAVDLQLGKCLEVRVAEKMLRHSWEALPKSDYLQYLDKQLLPRWTCEAMCMLLEVKLQKPIGHFYKDAICTLLRRREEWQLPSQALPPCSRHLTDAKTYEQL